MIAVSESQDSYLSRYTEREKELPGNGRGWVGEIRSEAIRCFAELGFPTTRNEEWKYTSVAPIAKTEFQPAVYEFNPSIADRIQQLPWADLECNRLVFINGRYCPQLSTLESPQPGIKVTSLRAALLEGSATLEQHLARYANYKTRSFVALNTAFMEDGAFLEVAKGVTLEKPIYLLYVSTAGSQPTISHPRNLVVVGRQSQVTLIEGYVGLDNEQVYFTNAVTELVAGDGAVIDHYKFQQESEKAFHIATLQFQQDRNCNLTAHTIAFGSALDREDLIGVMDGEGVECSLNGLYVTTGQQHVDNHTALDHAKPHCSSREIYKGVLDGKSTAVFNGKIIVRKDAQRTDAKQSNKNLLLSEGAVINTKPELQIYADDVKCTHGATIGQIDQEAIFYLRSRGIGHDEARNLLTYAFANDVLGRIKYKPLLSRLETALFARLAKDRRGEEA